MKECPKCHKVYNDNLSFCTIDGSELVVKTNQEINDQKKNNAFIRFLKSRGLRWALLITATFLFLYLHYFLVSNYFNSSIFFWIEFFSLLITLIVLYALLINNRSAKRSLFGLAAAFAVGFASYTCYYFNSAKYLIVSNPKIILPNNSNNGNTFIHIDIDCDAPWRVIESPSWLELTEFHDQTKGAIFGHIYTPAPVHGYITVKSGKFTRTIEIIR